MTHIFEPVTIGIAGLGGYAASIRGEILANMDGAHPAVKLAAVCDPNPGLRSAAEEELCRRGVRVFDSLPAMLEHTIEAVWLPVPIDLHRVMTEQALAAGKAVMVEKPAAGSVQDVDAMIAARDRAGRPCAVGFQDIYHPSTATFKHLILDGQLGRIRRASLLACWPRDDRYYARNAWAGALQRNGAWVLDSPANNALAHFVNLILFLLGPQAADSSAIESIEAELYRARPIENYDTASLRLHLAGDVSVLVLLTHACRQSIGPIVRIAGDRGEITLQGLTEATVRTETGTYLVSRSGARQHMIERFAALVRHQHDDRPVATLEASRQHTIAINGASEAAIVRDVPRDFVDAFTQDRGGTVMAIRDIERVFTRCAESFQMPHESALAPWTATPARRDLRGYSHFPGPAPRVDGR